MRSTLAFITEVADGMKMQWSVGIGADERSDSRNGMHRNGRSDRKHIWFPFTECMGYAEWGKGMTEWNEQNCLGLEVDCADAF